MEILDKIDADVKSLDSCAYSREVIGGLLQSIQKNVDQLSYGSYSNQVVWTENLSKKVRSQFSNSTHYVFQIEEILAIRVERASK